MSVRELLRDIDNAVEESLGQHEQYEAKKDGASRRKGYEKAIREVDTVAGRTEARRLAEWIEAEIRDEGKLPTARRVRQRGADVVREAGHDVPTGSWLGA